MHQYRGKYVFKEKEVSRLQTLVPQSNEGPLFKMPLFFSNLLKKNVEIVAEKSNDSF